MSGVMESISFSVSNGVQRRAVDGGHAAAQAQRRGLADLQVQVGRVLLEHEFEQLVHLVA